MYHPQSVLFDIPTSQLEGASAQPVVSYRGQLEQAFMNGQITGLQYQQALNQHMINQNASAAQRAHHNRNNSSTGGPVDDQPQDQRQFSSSFTNAPGILATNYPGSDVPHDYLYEKRASNPSQFEISSFELQNMASNLNAQQYEQFQNQRKDLEGSADLQQVLSQNHLVKPTEQSRQGANTQAFNVQQARTHRVQSFSGNNSSAIQRYSNLQNFNIKQRQANPPEAKEQQQQANMMRHSFHQQNIQSSFQTRTNQSQTRTDSNGPAPGVRSNGGQHSSGQSLNMTSQGLIRSRTTGVISMRSGIGSINCPCKNASALQAQNNQRFARHPSQVRSMIRADMGRKQPILQSSENTANCGHCGQFYAVKDQHFTYTSASGKKQVRSQQMIVKTIREKEITFKLDEPIKELFNQMRKVSRTLIENLQPHPFYLQKRVKRIDNISYIADTLQSDNQTIHHAVLLMDIYSSKMPKNDEYDTLLISLCCLLISTKYLQIKYPGADTLNDMVKKKYSADLIIHMEGVVLERIDWNLLVYTIYDYVKLFISQGCLFDNEEILKPNSDDILDDSTIKERPTTRLAEHFKKYAEFFSDFCMYQECFMTNDPYLLACAIVAYTRKFMAVAIIWPQEMEMLTHQSFVSFKNMYLIIESKYTENFPKHAKSQNYKQQLLTEPIQQTTQCSMRKNIMNQILQLSSGNKTQKTQNSSNKPANFNNILGDLKTPDKCVFDFNSIVSGNKTHDKFSHEKFQINSNSVEKFRLQKNLQNVKATTTDQQNKVQNMVFSDNKKQSINAHSFKKMIMKNQMVNNLSDEKQTNQMHQSLLKNYHEGIQNKREVHKKSEYLSHNQTQNVSQSMINSVNSPSANVNEAENEQQVQPFKPMIIKSNSQAIGGSYECKTTTKKSPSGLELEKINALREAMAHVNIQAKLPSSTTNRSTNNMKLNLNDSNGKIGNSNIFSNQNITSSYGAIGVNNGPIKINQKIKIVNQGSTQKSSQNTAQKSGQKSGQKSQLSSSSKKMQVSKSYVSQMQGKNLNNSYYQDRLAEQREARQNLQSQMSKSKLGENRNVSCTSHNQKISNPSKQFSYVSGKPKTGVQVYDKNSSSQGIATEGSANHYGGNVPQRSVMSIKNAAQVIKRKNSYQPNTQNQQTIDLKVNIKQNQQQMKQSFNAHTTVLSGQNKGKNLPNGLLRRATDGVQGKQKSIGALSNYMGGGVTASTAKQVDHQIQQNNQNDAVSLERTNPNNHLAHFDGDDSNQQNKYQDRPSSETRHDIRNKEAAFQSFTQSTKGGHGSNDGAVNPPAIIAGRNLHATGSGAHNAPLGGEGQGGPHHQMIKNKSFTLGHATTGAAAPLNREAQPGLAQGYQSASTASSKAALAKQQHANAIQGNSSHRGTNNYISMPHPMITSAEKNPDYQDMDGRPIQKMIKSGSQVLGKSRQRPKVTRGQMLKDLNDKKEKMSSLVEAAHATRCTSNEKGSSTKKNNFHETYHVQQKYTNTASHPGASYQQMTSAPMVSSFNLMAGVSNSHSQERDGTYLVSNQMYQDENSNSININSSCVTANGGAANGFQQNFPKQDKASAHQQINQQKSSKTRYDNSSFYKGTNTNSGAISSLSNNRNGSGVNSLR